MDEEINISEMLWELAEENQTRKILETVKEYKDIEEVEKIKSLLNK